VPEWKKTVGGKFAGDPLNEGGGRLSLRGKTRRGRNNGSLRMADWKGSGKVVGGGVWRTKKKGRESWFATAGGKVQNQSGANIQRKFLSRGQVRDRGGMGNARSSRDKNEGQTA